MSSRLRRDRARRELRRKIMDAARELFVERGYEAVTMRGIAERIEYSPTAIYFHFADKATLIRELVAHDFRALAERFSRLARIADPIERLRELGNAYVDFALRNPNHYRLMFMTPAPEGDGAKGSLAQGGADRDAYEFLRQTVQEGIAAGRFRPELSDPELLAQMCWAGVHGIVSLHITKARAPWMRWRPPRRTARLMIDAEIRGMTKRGK